MELPPELASLDYCYLTTTGRKSGQPREIEIWFGARGSTLYLLSGGGEAAHWVRNIRAEPRVSVRVGDRTFAARGRVVEPGTDEDTRARDLLVAKYQPGYGSDLSGWRARALPVALDLQG
ncbi:MAG: nitroreductase family deazaflavin-dependent oxidoreductase [Dehalococcoidia bacterium]|nr:nitroreductase family deazaflavin-dependent oxidoreductase [Dehalococcoidia bacterium]